MHIPSRLKSVTAAFKDTTVLQRLFVLAMVLLLAGAGIASAEFARQTGPTGWGYGYGYGYGETYGWDGGSSAGKRNVPDPVWQVVGTTGFSAGNVDYPSLAIDGSGTPYVAYRDWANSDKTTVKQFTDHDGSGTKTWNTVGTTGFSAGDANHQSLAIADDGTPYVAYRDNANSEKTTVKQFTDHDSDGTTTWNTVGTTGFSGGFSSWHSLAINGSGTPYVAYQDGANSSKTTVQKFASTGDKSLYTYGYGYGYMIDDSSNSTTISWNDAEGRYDIEGRDIGQKIVDAAILVPNGNSTTNTVATFHWPVQITLAGGTTITVPDETELTASTATDFSQLTSTDSGIDTSGLPSGKQNVEDLKFGLPSEDLSLNKEITVDVSIDSSYNGESLDIYHRSPESSGWSTLTTCTVSSGTCSFTTGSLSDFSVAEDTSSTDSSGGGGSGGSIDAQCHSLTASPSSTDGTEEVTLSWDTNITDGNYTTAEITHIGAVDGAAGETTVTPHTTTTYEATFDGQFKADPATCETTVTVEWDLDLAGCTDKDAENYNPYVDTHEEGSCEYDKDPEDTYGCTNPEAENYNPEVTEHEAGSCTFDEEDKEKDGEEGTDDPGEEETGEEGTDDPGEGDKVSTPSVTTAAAPTTVSDDAMITIIDDDEPSQPLWPSIAGLIGLLTGATTLPLRLQNILLAIPAYRRRHRPWGTVYDSETKQPLDPAYVQLFDEEGNEVAAKITDLDGRFGFLVDPGTYYLKAGKTNYRFPSDKLRGTRRDGMYTDLYFGEPVTITTKGELIARNIPMDPTGEDWNEQAKTRMKVAQFFSRHDMLAHKIIDILFVLGFLVSVYAVVVSPIWYNFLILAFYIVFVVVTLLGLTGRSYGKVTYADGTPAAGAVVRLYQANTDKEVDKRVLGENGHYYFLVRKGEYYLTVEDQKGEESKLLYTSSTIRAKQGIIKEQIKLL